MKKLLLVLAIIFFPGSSYAWVESNNVTITEMMVWENLDNGGPMHFKLSNNKWCYVPASQKTLHALIMSLYVSGKTISAIHCYDTADSNAGGSVEGAHKLHRIIAK
jgi:hypothetical protein